MVKGERQRQHASHHRSALMCHHEGGNPAGTDDRHLWRYNHETGEAAADHAEIRQRDGCPPKFFRWNRAGDRVGPQPVEPGSQVQYVALGDVAHYRHDEAALGIDRDTNIDALDRRLAPAPELYQALSAGSTLQAAGFTIARAFRTVGANRYSPAKIQRSVALKVCLFGE